MPKHSTLESGHHTSQETRAHKNLFRSASSPHFNQHGRRFPRSQASNPRRIQDGRCLSCRLHSVSSIVSTVAPRIWPTSTNTSATICNKTIFTIVQCCSTRWLTTVARIRIEAEIRPAFASTHTHPHLHTLTIPNTNSDSKCPLPPSHVPFANAA